MKDNQCFHCGENGKDGLPHTFDQCIANGNLCLNCGRKHPTSLCRAPIKEIFSINRSKKGLIPAEKPLQTEPPRVVPLIQPSALGNPALQMETPPWETNSNEDSD